MSTTTAPEQVEVEAPVEDWKGQSVPRKEDRRLLQGQGTFVDDVKRHGMGFIHFVRSPYAHAHITSIDVSKAESAPGVYGTLTGEEVASLTDPFFQISSVPGGNIQDYALAVGKVRYVGEAIVAVVAETRELARDASELVEIEYEPLPAIVDARHARDQGVPTIHEEAGGNLMWEGVYEWGDSRPGAHRPAQLGRRAEPLQRDRHRPRQRQREEILSAADERPDERRFGLALHAAGQLVAAA